MHVFSSSVINYESFQVITLEVTTLDFVSKNISDINLSDNCIIPIRARVLIPPGYLHPGKGSISEV